MVVTDLFEISDFWHNLAIFFIISKIKPNFLLLVLAVKNICNNLSQNHNFLKSIWKDFWANIPVHCVNEKWHENMKEQLSE